MNGNWLNRLPYKPSPSTHLIGYCIYINISAD